MTDRADPQSVPPDEEQESVVAQDTTVRLSLDDQLCFALYAATNAVTRAYAPQLDQIGLTYPQFLVMLVLWEDGPSTLGSVAKRLRLPSNAITPLVDRLEAKGLVERRRNAGDRRTVIVAPTAEGADLMEDAADAQAAVEARTRLDRDDLDRLRSDLHALTDRMEPRRD